MVRGARVRLSVMFRGPKSSSIQTLCVVPPHHQAWKYFLKAKTVCRTEVDEMSEYESTIILTINMSFLEQMLLLVVSEMIF